MENRARSVTPDSARKDDRELGMMMMWDEDVREEARRGFMGDSSCRSRKHVHEMGW